MREWADKGYWGKDVLSATMGGKENFRAGNSAGYLTHAQDWIGQYGADIKAQPESDPYFFTFAEANKKIKRKMGVDNSTVISTNSANPERALMVIEKFMTDESYYNLIQYGIEGKQYVIEDGIRNSLQATMKKQMPAASQRSHSEMTSSLFRVIPKTLSATLCSLNGIKWQSMIRTTDSASIHRM